MLVAHEPEGGAHGGRVNVDAVTDELTGEVAIRIAMDQVHNSADRSRVTMLKITHGIVHMDQMVCTGLQRLLCRGIIAIRVGQGYGNVIPNR